jgi:hypothetical protein
MNKRGRPRLPDHLRKTEQVRIVLTVDEYKSLLQLSESLGLSMSAIARQGVIGLLTERANNV